MKKAIIYTTKGDDGTTLLLRGERVAKDDVRVEAYGTIDELSACIALLQADAPELCHRQQCFLAEVQEKLFSISAFLADTQPASGSPVTAEDVAQLEALIDTMEASLPTVRGFLLPPTCRPAATANMCRTVCRRAERRIVTLAHKMPQPQTLTAYINRLSDYFFLLARLTSESNEKIWEKPCK